MQIDFANFMNDKKRVNDGHVGFILGVEGLSGQLAVVPVRNATTKSWERACRQMLESSSFNSIHTFMSDRDSAVKNNSASGGLRGRLKAEFGISWHFLGGRHKASRAER